MVKQMDKEIKGTGLHVNVADQNACLVMPVPFITVCPPLLTLFLDEGITFSHEHAHNGGLIASDRSQITGQRACVSVLSETRVHAYCICRC